MNFPGTFLTCTKSSLVGSKKRGKVQNTAVRPPSPEPEARPGTSAGVPRASFRLRKMCPKSIPTYISWIRLQYLWPAVGAGGSVGTLPDCESHRRGFETPGPPYPKERHRKHVYCSLYIHEYRHCKAISASYTRSAAYCVVTCTQVSSKPPHTDMCTPSAVYCVVTRFPSLQQHQPRHADICTPNAVYCVPARREAPHL